MQDEETTIEMPGTVTVDKIEKPVKIENIENGSIIIQNPDDQPLTIDNFNKQPLKVQEVNKTITVFKTEHGKINVIHEMTLGDVVTSTLLLLVLIFFVIERFIRR
ncbi:MAG TPA: hypothetical protein GX497_03385 [Bacillus bacterium]|nr:hypothetical protein [Bacillus sp. (in: firmicutes)]